ncbi:DUF2489 domain-containing protein [Aestuariibacter salexigens]|uniref:DUF2489 domain-containing protein n=1 Tax=Aestuariibacter salexigens TaxID=226010 RepID=UPI0003FC3D9B|nr:DUF2489 domain-containing protein [Aestuariibacter salexigens]
MTIDSVWPILAVIAVLIITGLSYYAGSLLYQLRRQTKQQNQVRQQRIKTMSDSIRTIAMAMQQQQCNLSEGAIRICRLLDAMPIDNVQQFKQDFPALHELFNRVDGFATHEERAALSKQQRRSQDREREEIEAELESDILKELPLLRSLTL